MGRVGRFLGGSRGFRGMGSDTLFPLPPPPPQTHPNSTRALQRADGSTRIGDHRPGSKRDTANLRSKHGTRRICFAHDLSSFLGLYCYYLSMQFAPQLVCATTRLEGCAPPPGWGPNQGSQQPMLRYETRAEHRRARPTQACHTRPTAVVQTPQLKSLDCIPGAARCSHSPRPRSPTVTPFPGRDRGPRVVLLAAAAARYCWLITLRRLPLRSCTLAGLGVPLAAR